MKVGEKLVLGNFQVNLAPNKGVQWAELKCASKKEKEKKRGISKEKKEKKRSFISYHSYPPNQTLSKHIFLFFSNIEEARSIITKQIQNIPGNDIFCFCIKIFLSSRAVSVCTYLHR